MPKPISQRGFSIIKGDNFSKKPGRALVSYEIDTNGLENILLLRGMMEWRVWMSLDDGEIKDLEYQSSQVPVKRITDCWEEHREELIQAKEIYEAVKKALNVDEELGNYIPRFSHPCEINLYNIMGIDNSSQIKSLIEKD